MNWRYRPGAVGRWRRPNPAVGVGWLDFSRRKGDAVMDRRTFISIVAGTLTAWPIAARAQQPERMRRIGVLMGYPENDLEGPAFFAAFRQGLDKLGWVEGRHIRLDTRWASPNDADARQRFAKELV